MANYAGRCDGTAALITAVAGLIVAFAPGAAPPAKSTGSDSNRRRTSETFVEGLTGSPGSIKRPNALSLQDVLRIEDDIALDNVNNLAESGKILRRIAVD